MKKILYLLILLLSYQVFAQKIPTIYTTSRPFVKLSPKEFKEWDKYLKICAKHNVLYEYFSDEDLKKFVKNKADLNFIISFEKKWRKKHHKVSESPWKIREFMGCDWYCGADYTTHVSSFLASSKISNYSKSNLDDNDCRTAWVEGKKGYGIGEFIEFNFYYGAPRATKVFIVNGYNKDETTWKNNSRVKSLAIYDNNKLIGNVALKDNRDIQSFKLPYAFPNLSEKERSKYYKYSENKKSNEFARLKFVITDVYKGDKYEDTAISEIAFDGLDVH